MGFLLFVQGSRFWTTTAWTWSQASSPRSSCPRSPSTSVSNPRSPLISVSNRLHSPSCRELRPLMGSTLPLFVKLSWTSASEGFCTSQIFQESLNPPCCTSQTYQLACFRGFSNSQGSQEAINIFFPAHTTPSHPSQSRKKAIGFNHCREQIIFNRWKILYLNVRKPLYFNHWRVLNLSSFSKKQSDATLLKETKNFNLALFSRKLSFQIIRGLWPSQTSRKQSLSNKGFIIFKIVTNFSLLSVAHMSLARFPTAVFLSFYFVIPCLPLIPLRQDMINWAMACHHIPPFITAYSFLGFVRHIVVNSTQSMCHNSAASK